MVEDLRDIVEELRDGYLSYVPNAAVSSLLYRAADQIEQLQAEVRMLSVVVMRFNHEKEELQSLLKQLREELKSVALVGPDYRAAVATLDKLDEMV